MDKTDFTHYMYRAFWGWLQTEIERGYVSEARNLPYWKPIDLDTNRELFDCFLDSRDEKGQWLQLKREHGATKTLVLRND